MLSAKDMSQLMNQCDNVDGWFCGGAGITKRGRNIDHNIASQPLPAIADAIHSPASAVIEVYPFPGKGDEQVIRLLFPVKGKVLFQSDHQGRCGGDLLLRRPCSGALNHEAY